MFINLFIDNQKDNVPDVLSKSPAIQSSIFKEHYENPELNRIAKVVYDTCQNDNELYDAIRQIKGKTRTLYNDIQGALTSNQPHMLRVHNIYAHRVAYILSNFFFNNQGIQQLYTSNFFSTI